MWTIIDWYANFTAIDWTGASGCREQDSREDKRKEVKSFPAEGLLRGAPPVTRGQLTRTTPQLKTSTPTSQISPKPVLDIILGQMI